MTFSTAGRSRHERNARHKLYPVAPQASHQKGSAQVQPRRAPPHRFGRIRLVLLVLAAAGCAACSGSVPRQAIPDYSRFFHSWATPQVTLYWDCTEVESGSLRIDGVGVNRWEPVPPQFLELSLYGVDAYGRVISGMHATAQGMDLLMNFPAPFHLELKEQGGEVRVDLAYRYQYRDDSLDGVFRWMPTYLTGRVPDACGKGGRQPQ